MSDSSPRYVNAWPIEDRIARWLERSTHLSEDSDCWLWHGARDRNGYGRVGVRGKTTAVHRVFYEYFIAEIPAGLEIDHLCRKRNCINPWHLEAVTRKTNMERAVGVGKYDRFKNVVRKRCTQGHWLDKDTAYITDKGRQACRRCQVSRAEARARLSAARGDACG